MSDVINSGVTKAGRDWTEDEWEDYLNSGRTPDDLDVVPVDYKALFRSTAADLKAARDKVGELTEDSAYLWVDIVNKLKELFKIGG